MKMESYNLNFKIYLLFWLSRYDIRWSWNFRNILWKFAVIYLIYILYIMKLF